MNHWPADFRGNLGEVIAVESSGHQRIGYLTGRRADKLWISQYHPEMESQKRWWNRFEDDERFTVGKIENIHTLSPPFLTPELGFYYYDKPAPQALHDIFGEIWHVWSKI